jgi:hypothetical protein
MSGQKLPNNALDDVTSPSTVNMRRRVMEVLNQLAALLPVEYGSWTAVIRGSGTAGTYEIATQYCRYTRMGRRVILDVWIQLAAVVTGGGTGDVQITGAPYAKKANTLPQGPLRLDGVGYTAGNALVLSHFSTADATAVLALVEVVSGAGAAAIPVSALDASDFIIGSICYETDDP